MKFPIREVRAQVGEGRGHVGETELGSDMRPQRGTVEGDGTEANFPLGGGFGKDEKKLWQE